MGTNYSSNCQISRPWSQKIKGPTWVVEKAWFTHLKEVHFLSQASRATKSKVQYLLDSSQEDQGQ